MNINSLVRIHLVIIFVFKTDRYSRSDISILRGQMNFQLLLQYPNNWTGRESKMMISSEQHGKTLLEARLSRMASLDGESVFGFHSSFNYVKITELNASKSTQVELIMQVLIRSLNGLIYEVGSRRLSIAN